MNSHHVFSWIERHTTQVLAGILIVTALLLLPYFLLAPESEATTDPPGEVFDAVEREECSKGVVPVENSTEGIINHTLDMFLESPLKI